MYLLRSPLFIVTLLLFGVHQILQLYMHVNVPLLDNYLDSLVLMPVLLTLLLAERQILFITRASYHLPVTDVIIATIYISFIAEWLFPRLSERFTADWLDVVCYFAGSLIFVVVNREKISGLGRPKQNAS